MEMPLTARSSFPSAFSFPLCYSTPDAESDSDTLAHCEGQLPTLRTVWSTTSCRDIGPCAKSGGRSQTTIPRYTPLSLTPPALLTNSAHEQKVKNECIAFALTTFAPTTKKDLMETTDNCPSGRTQGTSYSAPPALMFAASRGTSVASSFSSESIPVVTTSQGSTEHESSSYTVSGPGDGCTHPYNSKMLEAEQAGSSAPLCPRMCSTNQSSTEDALGAVGTSKRDVAEGNLMNNPELALSLESVLTVVPQSLRQPPSAGKTKEPDSKQFIKEQFLKKQSCDTSSWKPRYSTSSWGDVSFQSWDSHLEIDAAIEDIVESVIHELTICETDFHSCSDTFSRDDSAADVPRRASPASLSSYTSSKRLEWDNGADIGYSGASERTHGHERLHYPDVGSHIHRSNTSVLINEASVSPEEKTCMFAGAHLRDVVVQTESCSIKDAEVQANASATNITSTQTGVTALMEPPDLSVSSSGAEDLNSLAPTRREQSLVSPVEEVHQQNYKEREAAFVNRKVVDHTCAKQTSASKESFEMPMQDYASSVSLCYSHRILKEPSSSKKHTSSIRKHAVDNIGWVERRQHDIITAPDASDRNSDSLDVTGFTIINNNRLKMRFPTVVPGLASRTATPAELPRACSELNKRRLDHWLSSGFPYVPAVAPLETGALPRIRTADPVTAKRDCCDPRLVVSGSSLPSLTLCQEATGVTTTEPAGTAAVAGGMIRKRYIARPAPRHAPKSSQAGGVFSVQPSAPFQKLVRRDQLSIGLPTKPSFEMMSDTHSGMPSLSKAAKSTLPSRGHSEDALLSRGESEVCSSPELSAASRKQVCDQHSSSTSYSTASEGSSQLLTVNGKSCKLKRLAHKELEKLRFLVDRQRHGYLKQLQREVERLHRLEQLFLLADGSRTASSPEVPTTSTEKNSREDARRSTSKNSVAVQTSQFLESCRSEDDVAKDRCFVSVGGGSGVKKQRDHLSPRKRKAASKRPVAWVVPFGSNSQRSGSKHQGSSPKGRSQHPSRKEESLQAAFAAHCSRLIKRSEARQFQVASLAERRRTQRAVLPQAQDRNQVHSLPPGTRDGAPTKKTFTHKEMREQTERVYRKLPEVIDSKKRLHREQQYRRNRLMAQLYKKAIQEKALLGHVNFPLNKPFTQL